MVIAGDTFHTRRPSPAAMAMLAEAVARLQARGIVPVVLPGNHDGMNTIGWATSHTLRWMAALSLMGVRIVTAPLVEELATRDGSVILTAMPYPHKRAFDTDPQLAELDPQDRVLEAGKRVERVIEALADQAVELGGELPRLFAGHLSVAGAAFGTEQAMRMEWDAVVRAEVFDRFDYAALGHIHRQQQLSPRAWYAGSPDFHGFADAGEKKGFLLAVVERGKEPVVELVPSGARKMGVLTLEQNTDGTWPGAGPPPGMSMRLSSA